MVLYFLLGLFTLLAVYRLYRLFINYQAARALQLPIILLPTSFEEPLWILLRPLFSWVERLPFGLGGWYRYTDIGWLTIDGQDTISRIGESFVLVSPARNQIVTAYPPAADRIYKEKNFIIPTPFADSFTFYGENVSSTNGVEWQRHRKITGAGFNERNNRYVWDESIRRTDEIIDSVSDATIWTLAKIRSKFEILAMHVLVDVAFGQDTDLTTISKGHKMSLMDSLGFILKNIFISIIFSGLKLPDFLLPSALRKLKLSVSEFRLYMEESVLKQIQSSKSQSTMSTGKVSLLEAIVSANEAEKQELQNSTSRPSFLADSELYGNLFVFNLAGYETTAGTMSFALPYLAAHPEVQEWLIEEIDTKYTSFTSTNYEETYPKLVRCLAFMYEVLRLSSPAPQMIRAPTVPTVLQVSPSSSITVNPDTILSAHFYGLHLSPRWGDDVNEFNPRRWVTKSSHTGEETLASPPEGAMFIAWVFGARVCPGKKFSQVEFVAVIAHLFSLYRVGLMKQSNSETDETARERLMSVLDDKYFNVSTHFKRPHDASIRLVRRKDVKSG